MPRKDIHIDGKKTQFTKDRQPEGRGRPLGVKNRSTILSKWLSTNLELVHPITKEKQKGTVEDEVILALVTKARKGDVTAIRECLDTMYGKIKEQHELTGGDGESLLKPVEDALLKIYNASK